MKNVPVLAVAAVALVTGCAAMPNAVTALHAKDGTYYCQENRLSESGGRLVCNWNADANAACEDHVPSYIERSSVRSGPQHLRRCWNGEGLAVVTAG